MRGVNSRLLICDQRAVRQNEIKLSHTNSSPHAVMFKEETESNFCPINFSM